MIKELITSGMKLKCKYYLPDTQESSPLLVFLHGIGEVGDNIDRVMKYGPLQQLNDAVDIGPVKDWIVVHPQNPHGQWQVSKIDDVIEYFINNYKVDTDQVFLMGVSLGGWGVWNYASSENHVKKIAAIVPICGGSNNPEKAPILVKEGIPGWAAHAENDPTVAFNITKRMVDIVNNLSGKCQIMLSQYGMFGHNAWSYFLKPEYRVYEWLKYQRLSHRKQNTNLQVLLRSGDYITIKVE